MLFLKDFLILKLGLDPRHKIVDELKLSNLKRIILFIGLVLMASSRHLLNKTGEREHPYHTP